jgi:hypothetical protein
VQAILSVASCSKNANQAFFLLSTKSLCGQPFALFFSKKVGRKGFLSQQSSGVSAQTTRKHRLIQDG